MKNFISDGDTITVVVSDTNGIESGDGILVNDLFGVACADGDPGDSVALQLVGVFELPKDSSDISGGQAIYWTGTACTTTQDSNALIGAAVESAGTSATTVKVRLNGISI